MIEEKAIDITKTDMVKAYLEIKSLENKKELKMKLYFKKHNIQSTKLKEIISSGGTQLIDSILNKIIISDELLDEIIMLQDSINEWTKYLNNEISIRLRCEDITPLIIFFKDYKDLETDKFRTFLEVADLVNYSERTVKRKYYDYKDSLK